MDYLWYFLIFISIAFPFLHSVHCLPIFRRNSLERKRRTTEDKGASILIPCYNEEGIIETSVSSMKTLSYSKTEILYINDGSTDETFAKLDSLLALTPCMKAHTHRLQYRNVKGVYQSEYFPHIFVLDKVNGGKADALNAGIEYSSQPLIVTLDADTILTDEALPAVNQAFSDENVIAAGGVVHVLQTKVQKPLDGLSLKAANMLVRAQALDFMKAFYVNKVSLARFKALAVISGAFGIFTKKALLDVGGYRSTVGEDIDITLKMHKYMAKHKKSKVLLIRDAVCYTELPENWKDLFKQRVRWQKAFVDCLFHFGPFLLKTLFTKPVSFFYLFEGFFAGTMAVYIMTGVLIMDGLDGKLFSWTFLLLYVAYIFGVGLVYDMVAIGMSERHGYAFQEKDTYPLLMVIIFDIFFYRFITMFAVIFGTVDYFFNRKAWNKVARTGRHYETGEETAA
ncbi:glycosyltransferase family 2 protein [Fictibacillus enclensis]|uniref:glycosyltransferase family 2 protein n=1 Tax=Fictibacillus enclensis TaxID=1017270 RepID=UPI0024BF4D32|nr:glycosyltransferase [Fictibacillus enclensis]WHY72814.1 glycosyltransferase [Fictibacillus enclensis]